MDALDSGFALTTLLRKVKLAAVKLGLTDALEWVDSELNGYTTEVPDYRKINGKLKWYNPYHGYLPVGFQDNATAEKFETWSIPEPITSLESTLASGDGTFHLQMPASVTRALSSGFGLPVTSAILDVPKGSVVAIIEHVRGLVLNWALELERAGIMGEGMSFTMNEREKAKSAHIAIGNFQGTFNTGELSGSNSRIVQNSEDNSINVASHDELFSNVERVIETAVNDPMERAALLDALKRLQSSPPGESRVVAYRQLISDAANHLTLLAPFLPALTAFLG